MNFSTVKKQYEWCRLEHKALYIFILFCVLPVIAGLLIPFFTFCESSPEVGLWRRALFLLSGAMLDSAVILLIFLMIAWSRVLSSLYIFILFPVSVSVIGIQYLSFNFFGSEINQKVFEVFEGNFAAIWATGVRDHYLGAILFGVCICSILTGVVVLRYGYKGRWVSKELLALICLLGLGLNLLTPLFVTNVKLVDIYSPMKIVRSAFGDLIISGYAYYNETNKVLADYLRRGGNYNGSDISELELRLGSSAEDYLSVSVDKPTWLKQKPSHVFLFLLESVDYDVVADADLESLSPNLNRYAKEGISVDNYFATGIGTMSAVHGIVAGLPHFSRPPHSKNLLTYQLSTLPRVMERSGYNPVFRAASHRRFGYKGDVCESYGFDFMGAERFDNETWGTEWGLHDGDFFNSIKDEFSNLKQPTFAMFLNVSNHSPHHAPVDDVDDDFYNEVICKRFSDASKEGRLNLAKHMVYADREFSVVVDMLKEKYPKSLIVIVGDHRNAKFISKYPNQVPLVLLGEEVLDLDQIDEKEWRGSHMDLLASLSQLVLSPDSTITSFGRPLWSSDKERITITDDQYLGRGYNLSRDLNSVDELAGDQDAESFFRYALSVDALAWAIWNDVYLLQGN